MKKKDEIERRFLFWDEPFRRLDLRNMLIVQFYVPTKDSSISRYRHEGGSYYHVTKRGKGMVRAETTRRIQKREYLEHWSRMVGREVVKRRFYLPSGPLTLEIDIFMAQLHGLKIVEIEFPNETMANKFTPPCWFAREVTDDSKYGNFSLATRGLPKGVGF